MRAVSHALSSVVLLLLAGCGSGEPNANFEQVMKERNEAARGDRYADMDGVPRAYRYARAADADKLKSARNMAVGFGDTYDSLLKKLDAEPPLATATELTLACRPAFAAASAFQASTATAEADKPAATALFSRLNACRNQALAVEGKGDSDLKDRAFVLRRFASAGMSLVAVSAIAHEDTQTGLDLWAQSEKLVVEDTPGFKFTPHSLLGY